jgi:hypothetical protein
VRACITTRNISFLHCTHATLSHCLRTARSLLQARRTCSTCGNRLFAERHDRVRGVTATLLPAGLFQTSFHINCESARLPVRDALPHYRRLPAFMRGTGETLQW